MFIDTHCHLSKKDYQNLDDVINEMKNNIMITSGCDHDTNIEVIDTINNYSNVYGVIGIHPEEASNYKKEDLDYIEKNIQNPKIVGIGEIGLDYHYDGDIIKQKELFIKQIEIAKKYNKTIVIHSRDAIQDTLEILNKYKSDNLKIVMHCFSSSLEVAKELIKSNVKLGIGGVLTFKNSIKLKEIVKELSLANFLLETDCPYLSPEPFRGKQNRPYNCYFVAQKIAEIKQIPIEDVFRVTTNNAIEQFDLDI